MSPETQPTAAALEAAQIALPCLCGGAVVPTAGQHTTPQPHSTSCPKVYVYKVAAAMDAYAAERIKEATRQWLDLTDHMQRDEQVTIERSIAVEAEREAAHAD